ncbi:MAG TPA: hypothetical protein VK622_14645 [Puia sp.]|nr:hypothetical protein [Puia sp.]
MKRWLCILITLSSFGQAAAQDQQMDNLQQQYRNYQSANQQEKLFVHTDKNFYLAGETVWFKVYSVDASSHKTFTSSSVAYLEILTKDQKPVVQSKVAVNGGSGSGSLILPASLGTGNYVLRAYTSWMKNFSADFYYQHSLHIVNTLKLTAPGTEAVSPSIVEFFPEGGHMVQGLATKIAFKMTGTDGRGLDGYGAVINDHNDTLSRFRPLYNGMGNFLFKPEKDQNYYAVVYCKDTMLRQKLPVADQEGVVMTVSNESEDNLSINIQASPDLSNTRLYLFVHTRNILKNVQTGLIKGGQSHFVVNKKDLGEGISTVTLLNSDRQPVCERLVFKRPTNLLLIDAKTDQSVYLNRKPVMVDLKSTGKDHNALSGNMSVSVFLIDSLQHIPEHSIVYYLYLSSDLKGYIQSPEYYFTHSDKEGDDAVDNLLLTQGWRRFKWNDVFENRKPAFEFLPELEGPVVNGKIINKVTGSPVGNAVAYLSIPGADYAFSSATSNADGLIRFGFKDIYKNNALVVQPAQQKDVNYRIDITSAFSDKYASVHSSSLNISKIREKELTIRSIGNQVENTYAIEKKRRYATGNPDTSSFYGQPDRRYYLEDYTRFQTMEEVMREFVEDVRVRKEGDHFTFKVRNRLFGTYFENDPLILLDGIPVSDASKIIALDPLKINKIEVVMHKYYLGSSVFEGIINIKSYSGEIGATQIDPNALVVEYEGLQQQREFYSPSYTSGEMEASHIPDYRNVLYWAPQIITGAEGKAQLHFYTSDLKGKFAVIIQGITEDGRPGKAVTQFEVNDAK